MPRSKEQAAKYRAENREAIRQYARRRYWANPEAARARAKADRDRDPVAARKSSEKWKQQNPHRAIFLQKRALAKRYGIDFNVSFADLVWPEFCPVLGLKIDYTRYTRKKNSPRDNSASFDRVDNTKGYTKENTRVISNRANRLKSDSTLPELKRLVLDAEKIALKCESGVLTASAG